MLLGPAPAPWTAALRRGLAGALPPSHVPVACALALGPFPTTAVGKVDRQALHRRAQAHWAPPSDGPAPPPPRPPPQRLDPAPPPPGPPTPITVVPSPASAASSPTTPLTPTTPVSPAQPPLPSAGAIAAWLGAAIARHTGHPPDPEAPFLSLGLSSVLICDLAAGLRAALGLAVSPAAFYQDPTVAALAAALAAACSGPDPRPDAAAAVAHAPPPPSTGASGSSGPPPLPPPNGPAPPTGPSRPPSPAAHCQPPIALAGVGCRLPGGVQCGGGFWRLLQDGREAVGPAPDRARGAGAGGYLTGSPFDVDAEFFGLTAAEVQWMDPQQRITLHVAWEALEDAGARPGLCALALSLPLPQPLGQGGP